MTLRDFKALVAAIPEEHDDRLVVVQGPNIGDDIRPMESDYSLGHFCETTKDLLLYPTPTKPPAILFYAINV